jgi:ribonuclease HII
MPWIIGIDEAGYGPNLGPLVMTSVALRVPENLLEVDFWSVFKKVVRRHDDPADGRLLIDDSKLVYTPADGLLELETGVLAILGNLSSSSPSLPSPHEWGNQRLGYTLEQFIDWLSPSSHHDLRQEPWYAGTSGLPVMDPVSYLQDAANQFRAICSKREIELGPVRSIVICPPRFNQWLKHWRSKGAVLGQGLMELMQFNRRLENDETAIHFTIDKHGGRNYYAAMLQSAVGDGMVVAHREGRHRSVYSVLGLKTAIRVTIQPFADREHFCVALASMTSKYLRELLMREFNQFWRAHLPDLKPTAGYPGDSRRFFRQIHPVAKQLGIPKVALWRQK